MLAVLALPLLILAGLMLMQRLEEVLLPAAPSQPHVPAPAPVELRIEPALAGPDERPRSAAQPVALAAEAPKTRGRAAGAAPSCPHRRHPHQRRHPAKAA
ncbi:hypothetical protein [Nonomuraea fuscirosea]|uniref:hypothetical protein n=1 Tax=Nonomuraea fuscirosea TaxID=1291556 RepID=UPI003437504A